MNWPFSTTATTTPLSSQSTPPSQPVNLTLTAALSDERLEDLLNLSELHLGYEDMDVSSLFPDVYFGISDNYLAINYSYNIQF
jgi:hypothetical protein